VTNPKDLLNALDRADSDVADTVVADIALTLYERGWREDVVKNAPAVYKACRDRSDELRVEVIKSYRDVIARTADPREARVASAAVLSRLDRVVKAADGVADVWGWVSKDRGTFVDQYGNTRRVKRDASGRFSRTMASSGKVSGDQLKARTGRNKLKPDERKNPPAALATILGENQPDMSQPGVQEQVEAEERRAFAVNEAIQLQRELKQAFGDDAPKIDVALRYLDSAGNIDELGVPASGDFGKPGELESLEWANSMDPNAVPLDLMYGPAETQMDAGKRRDISNRLMLSQVPGLDLQSASPEAVSAAASQLAALSGGPTNAGDWDKKNQSGVHQYAERALRGVEAGARLLGAEQVAGPAGVAADAMSAMHELRDPMMETMWRYRGTEKKPAPGWAAQVEGSRMSPGLSRLVNGYLAGEVDGQTLTTTVGDKRLDEVPKAVRALMEMQRRTELQGKSPEQAMKMAQRQAAASNFLDKMKRQMSQQMGFAVSADGMADTSLRGLLSQVAGDVGMGFPSEGVVLNADGKVAQQSVGMGEDHYLPFNLASVGAMAGGSYVRTREYGGLTAEDMRALITSGARAATVVSRSGVFDVEVNPDFRGGRRLNDKTAQIPMMYERILDAVTNSERYVVDAPKEKIQEWHVEAARKGVPPGQYVKAEKEKYLQREGRWTAQDEKRLLSESTLQWRKEKGLSEDVSDEAIQSDPSFTDWLGDEKKKAKKRKIRKLKLNGEGYEVALKTLAMYYPYAFRTTERIELTELDSRMSKVPATERGGGRSSAQFLESESPDHWYVKPWERMARGKNGSTDLKLFSRGGGQTDGDDGAGVGGVEGAPTGGGGAGGRMDGGPVRDGGTVDGGGGGAPGDGGGGPGGGGGNAGGAGGGVNRQRQLLAPAASSDKWGVPTLNQLFTNVVDETVAEQAGGMVGSLRVMLGNPSASDFEPVVEHIVSQGRTARGDGGAERFNFVSGSGPIPPVAAAKQFMALLFSDERGDDDMETALKLIGRTPGLSKHVSDPVKIADELTKMARAVTDDIDSVSPDDKATQAMSDAIGNIADLAVAKYTTWVDPRDGESLTDAYERTGGTAVPSLTEFDGKYDADSLERLAERDDLGNGPRVTAQQRAELVEQLGRVDSIGDIAAAAAGLVEARRNYLDAAQAAMKIDDLGQRDTNMKTLFERSFTPSQRGALVASVAGDEDALIKTPVDATAAATETALQVQALATRILQFDVSDYLQGQAGDGDVPKGLAAIRGSQDLWAVMSEEDKEKDKEKRLERQKDEETGFKKTAGSSSLVEALTEAHLEAQRVLAG